MQIRTATASDWAGIWPFLSVVLAAGETYTYPQDISQAQAREAWLLTEPWHVVVAHEEDQILGIAKYGPNWPGRGAHVANASFVVDPALAGRGVGRALAEHVLAAARDRGFRAMQFNAVVETNTGAVALWRSLGFRILATVPEAFDHPTEGLVGLHIMHRYLWPARARPTSPRPPKPSPTAEALRAAPDPPRCAGGSGRGAEGVEVPGALAGPGAAPRSRPRGAP